MFGPERRRVERKVHGEMSRVLRYLVRAEGRAELHPPGIVREQAWAQESGGSAIFRSRGQIQVTALSISHSRKESESGITSSLLPLFFFSPTF